MKDSQIQIKKQKLKKGYSLIEIIFSLAIMGFAITVMFSFLILSLRVSVLSLSRSFVREELTNISGLVARDIRNADYVIGCGTASSPETCSIVQNGNNFIWQRCDANGEINTDEDLNTRVCKLKSANGQETVMFISSDVLKIENFTFSLGYTDSTSDAKTNIIVLINASHSNSNYNINNVVRQISVSTRNF